MKMKMQITTRLALFGLIGGVSQAAVVINFTPISSSGVVAPSRTDLSGNVYDISGTGYTLNHGFTPSQDDLLHGLTPSAFVHGSGGTRPGGTGEFNVLTDGGFPVLSRSTVWMSNDAPNAPADGEPFAPQHFVAGGDNGAFVSSITYTLAAASNITEIAVYGGWQDGGRDQHSYQIFYATASNPHDFVELVSVNEHASPLGYNAPIATRVRLYDGVSEYLAEDVVAIRFDFGTTINGWAGYAEIDVFGQAIPEPSSLAFLSLGLLTVGRRKR